MARWILLDGVVERSKRWSVRLSPSHDSHTRGQWPCGLTCAVWPRDSAYRSLVSTRTGRARRNARHSVYVQNMCRE